MKIILATLILCGNLLAQINNPVGGLPAGVTSPGTGSLTGTGTFTAKFINISRPTTAGFSELCFCEGSGTTLTDLSGNGNNGTLSGGSWTTQGISGASSKFHVSLPTSGINTVRSIVIAYKTNPDLTNDQTLFRVVGGTGAYIQSSHQSGTVGNFSGQNSPNTVATQPPNSDVVFEVVFGSPNHVYLNGYEVSAYIIQDASFVPSGSATGVDLGDYPGFENSAFSFLGTMEYAVLDTTAHSATQALGWAQFVQQQISSRGGIQINAPLSQTKLVFAGDSIVQGLNGNYPAWDGIAARLLGGVPFTVAAIVGQRADQFSFANTIAGLATGNPQQILDYWEGINDIAGGTNAATVYASITSVATSAHNAGLKFVANTLLPDNAITGGQFTSSQTVNTSIRNAYTAGTFEGLVDAANDPICGQSQANIATAQCSPDGVHPSAKFNNRVATIKSIAIGAALGKTVSCPVFTIAATAGTWSVNDNKAYSSQTLQLGTSAAATTQTLTFFHIQQNWRLIGVYTNVTTGFSATGLTSLTTSIGDSSGGTTFYTQPFSILTAGYLDFGGLGLGQGASGGSDLTVNLTANQNLNANAISGSEDITACFSVAGSTSGAQIPTSGANSVKTPSNCSSSASPAVCGAAAAGSVVVAASATTVTVNTTAVTANSQIFIQPDDSLGTKLGVTCNTTGTLLDAQAWVSARTAATSFVITVNAAPSVNPECFSYFIVN